MKNKTTSNAKSLFLEGFASFILLLGFIPDIVTGTAVNVSCLETVVKGDIFGVQCAIDAAALVREYGCESTSDMVNFTINSTKSQETQCSVQFLHSSFCLTFESSSSFCKCVNAEENILTYQYFFQPSDEDMDGEIFCSVGCYKSSKYFLIESDRCKVFSMRNNQSNPGLDQHSMTTSNNTPRGVDDDFIKKMFERQQKKLLAELDAVKSQLTSAQEALNALESDISVLNSRILFLEASYKEMKVKDEAQNGMAWRSTAGKTISAVIGAITILSLLGIVLRKKLFQSLSSQQNAVVEMQTSSPGQDEAKKKIRNVKNGAVLKKYKLKRDREEIKQDKMAAKHELGSMNV